ncbi:proton-coupled zinc antiporter SLC30A5-like [Neocloeon triangulifer]|uniref:proton-coupled zinc antiporter SLC30A5-like n=1 Tax=Neocloeon triangulifer TaxID=2078957 RepID=UPI00286F35F7|nr:proton-coupled zinc antiporter SLC30A5-like [Neocloeon triangulifer]
MNHTARRLRSESANPHLQAIYPNQKPACFLALLISSKLTYCIGVFLAYDILRQLHVIPLLCLLKLIAGCLFVIVQKPLTNGQPLTEAQWLQTIYLAVGRVLVSILWFYGISLSGPFRAILVCEQYDFVVVAGFTALTSGAGGNSAFRGALTFLIGLLVLLFLDHDEGNLHPDADHTSSGGSWIGLADHKVGVILMVLVMLVQVGVNSIANKLGSSLGGQKRIHSLTTVFEGIILIPISVFIYAYKGASPDFTLSTYIMPMITSAICIYFLEFYINSFTLQRLQPTQVARVGSISVFLSSLLCAYLWSSAANQVTKADPTSYTVADHSLSGGSIFACILFILASLSLTSDAKQGTKGSFIGYSETGLPLYSFRNSALHQTSKSFVNLCTTIVKQILANQNSRKIFYFLCVNMAFTVVEFVYGVWTNSLGLISDGFHMLFDCSALIMGLVASVMATWKPSRTFSYGYNRVEDLSGFVNGLFLLVISFGVFTEAVSRLFDPPDINTNQLLAVSFAGLCVNLLGILAFRHNPGGSHGHSHGGGHHGHSHNSNMEGVFLHILADTMGSVGVIISSLLIENFGWYIADPICSILISILIFLSVIPLLKNSAYVLLLRVPPKALKEMTTGFKRVQAIDGVVGVKDPYLWQHTSSANIGTLRVQVSLDAVEQRVVQQVTAIFKSMGFTEFTTQVEKPDFPLHLTNLGVNYNSISKIAGHFDNKLLSNPDAVVNVKFV